MGELRGGQNAEFLRYVHDSLNVKLRCAKTKTNIRRRSMEILLLLITVFGLAN